jgi:hypothetical protein
MEGREGKGGQREDMRGEDEAHRARKARGRRQNPAAGHCPPATGAIATCATPDLLLKHPDEVFAT